MFLQTIPYNHEMVRIHFFLYKHRTMNIIRFGKNNINAEAAPTPAPDTELDEFDNVDK